MVVGLICVCCFIYLFRNLAWLGGWVCLAIVAMWLYSKVMGL